MNSINDYKEFSDSTEYLVISTDLYKNLYDDFTQFLDGHSMYIVADENTMSAAGNEFLKFCSDYNIQIEDKLIFPAEPELTSDYSNIELIIEQLSNSDSIIIAIGSGTINDLVKRASTELHKPYAILATAASVDGYASDGAAIMYKGLKQTLSCAAPTFIAADTDVLKNAPFEMTSSGYADLLAKNPAGADWILADALDLDPIDNKIWQMIQGNLKEWTKNPHLLKEKNEQSFNGVFTGLNVAGFAMQYMKRSRPVSGAEHLMSHIWEMEGHTHKGHHVSHGFKVAIGSLASIALWECIINRDFTKADIPKALDLWPGFEDKLQIVETHFSHTNALDDLIKINKEKYIDKETLEKRLLYLAQNWTELQGKISKQLIPYKEYKKLLIDSGAPGVPEEIGLSIDKVVETYIPAQMMRNRHSILDLAVETGLLADASDKIRNSTIYLR